MADPVNPDDRAEDTPPDEPTDQSGAESPSAADDAAADALKAAMAAVSGLRDEADGAADPPVTPDANPSPPAEPVADTAPAAGNASEQISLPEFSPGDAQGETSGIDLLSRVNLNVRIELGRTKMLVEDVLRLNEGSVVELDKLAGDPVDIYVNDRLVACGEVLVLNDAFSVRINEIVGQELTSKLATSATG